MQIIRESIRKDDDILSNGGVETAFLANYKQVKKDMKDFALNQLQA